MKTRPAQNFACSAAIFFFVLSIATASAQPGTNSLLGLVRSNGAVWLSISNAGDEVWVIQNSSDLTTWTAVESVKVFNGRYRRSYANSADGNLFYRTFYDPTMQNIADFTTNALLLPATNFNYAAPSLPASFSQPDILAEDNTPSNNVTTDVGATLGRVLFYDKRLSTNQ